MEPVLIALLTALKALPPLTAIPILLLLLSTGINIYLVKLKLELSNRHNKEVIKINQQIDKIHREYSEKISNLHEVRVDDLKSLLEEYSTAITALTKSLNKLSNKSKDDE